MSDFRGMWGEISEMIDAENLAEEAEANWMVVWGDEHTGVERIYVEYVTQDEAEETAREMNGR